MKKNKLIEILQKIKGNPDVKLWNGMVGDWMDVEIIESELVKESEEFVRFWHEMSWKKDNKISEIPEDVQEQIEKDIKIHLKEREWEFPNQYVAEKDEKCWYGNNRKKILLINGKKRGKKTWDRMGEMYY